MMVFELVRWWYTTGWAQLAKRVEQRGGFMLETFSVKLLLRSLFEPFRQIDAGQVRGGLDVQLRAWGDRTFSRVFGAVVRSIFIAIGGIAALLAQAVGVAELLLWPVVPALPLLGLIVTLTGWKP